MTKNRKKSLLEFIDDIPDSKLQGFPNSPTTLFRDDNFRLDMQGITSKGEWNLKFQVNFRPKIKSLGPFAPNTIAGPVLVSPAAPLTPDEIRDAFRDTRDPDLS